MVNEPQVKKSSSYTVASDATKPPIRQAVKKAEQWLFDLDSETADRLWQTWIKAMGENGEFGEIFYQQLFQAHPALVALFPGDMSLQQSRLVKTLGEAVELVRAPERLILLLQAAGVRHYHYHVQQKHFALMEQVLIDTLVLRLGTLFQAEDAAEWRRFFQCMAIIMRHSMATTTH